MESGLPCQRSVLRQAEHSKQPAIHARSSLSRFFVWAIGEGICDENPVSLLKIVKTSRKPVLNKHFTCSYNNGFGSLH